MAERSLFLRGKSEAPVATGIIVSIHFTVISPDDNGGIIICRINKIITGFRDRSSRTGKQPIFFPDVLPFHVKFRDLCKMAAPGFNLVCTVQATAHNLRCSYKKG
jgi:hypothetical protein